MDSLGKRIKYLRIKNNISQQVLADTLNIATNTLSQYESNLRTPSDDIKSNIANFFDVSLDYLLGNTPLETELKIANDEFYTAITELSLDSLKELSKYVDLLLHKNSLYGMRDTDTTKKESKRMNENFMRKPFKEIDLNDEFFDSLKKDYKEFTNWFNTKAIENDSAFIQLVNNNLSGFLYLKEETGPITDVSPKINCTKAIKIGTFKINSRGTRLGERFIKKSLDFALNKHIDTVYVTIFSHHNTLLNILLKFGFEIHGSKTTANGTENVLVKRFSKIHNDILLDYPKVNANSNTFLLGIYPQYHTRLFPDSKLFTETFDVIQDVSHTNSITKIYIGKMSAMSNIKPGNNLVIYRTSDQPGRAYFRSVATTICTVEDIKSLSSFSNINELNDYCKNYSIFTDVELNNCMRNPSSYYIIKMLYNVSLNKRITQGRLKDEIGINPSYWGLAPLTKNEFLQILDLGEVNNDYLK